MESPQTDRLGVAALEYFFSESGWLFREQTIHDYGIDAHIEIVNDHRPTGKLIAIQIKSGTSFFSEETENSFVFRADDKHIAYWVGHSMPVVVVIYNPETKNAYWKYISRGEIETTGKNWKTNIPKISMFDDPVKTLQQLESLTQPEPYIRRLNRLRADRRWIDLIESGEEVKIEFDDWIHKSLPRYQIAIYCRNESEVWPTLYAPGSGIESMLEHFFPWANFSVDKEAHCEGAESGWEAECYQYHDSETGRSYYSEEFEEWYEPPKGLVPVSENGETASYCLVLSLNELGKSFLAIDDYLSDDSATESIGFTLE